MDATAYQVNPDWMEYQARTGCTVRQAETAYRVSTAYPESTAPMVRILFALISGMRMFICRHRNRKYIRRHMGEVMDVSREEDGM